MKTIVLALLGLSAVVSARAQSGFLVFSNDVSSLVMNGLTESPVSYATTPGIRAALYLAPDGTTDEGAFYYLTNTVVGQAGGPGRYGGGMRLVPGVAPGQAVMVQVRAYETNYGNSYEACLVAPPQGSRRALVGKSAIGRAVLGTNGPFAPRVGPIVGGFTIFPVDGPAMITANDLAVAEGTNGTASATFAIRLLGAAVDPVTVDYTTADGTALAGSDYTAVSGTVTFAPGETVKNVAVTLLPDADPEGQETFSLVLSNPQGAALLRSTIVCTVVEVRITSVTVDTVLTFNTLAGRRYMVERSADGLNWSPVAGATNLLASGTSLTATDRGNGCAGMSLYRVNLLP